MWSAAGPRSVCGGIARTLSFIRPSKSFGKIQYVIVSVLRSRSREHVAPTGRHFGITKIDWCFTPLCPHAPGAMLVSKPGRYPRTGDFMMKRIALAVAIFAIGVTAVVAQSDPIAARKALMKGNNDNARNLVKMTRGEEPYDAVKVNAAFAQWAETAQRLPNLFPDNSKTGGETRATPKVWETRSDFDAKIAAFGKVVA